MQTQTFKFADDTKYGGIKESKWVRYLRICGNHLKWQVENTANTTSANLLCHFQLFPTVPTPFWNNIYDSVLPLLILPTKIYQLTFLTSNLYHDRVVAFTLH